jgi:hypothetical protein
LDDEKYELKNVAAFRDALLLDKQQEAVKMSRRLDILETEPNPPLP